MRDPVQRWRLVISRPALAGDPAQGEQSTNWETALAATGLPFAGLDAPRPRPRLAFAAPLAAGASGEAELADVWLTERLPRWRVREALAGCLPPEHVLRDLYDVWLGEPALPGRVAASVYRATIEPPAEIARLGAAARQLLAADSLPRERRKGEKAVRYDLRPFVQSIDVVAQPDGSAVVRLVLLHDSAKGVGRPDEALAALADALGDVHLEPSDLVRERIVLAEPPPPAPSAPKGPRRPREAASPKS